MTHTPGPWQYLATAGGEMLSLSNDTEQVALIQPPRRRGNWQADKRLILAAPLLLAAMEAAECPCWVHNAAHNTDIESLRAIAIWYAKWNNEIRLAALAAAKG